MGQVNQPGDAFKRALTPHIRKISECVRDGFAFNFVCNKGEQTKSFSPGAVVQIIVAALEQCDDAKDPKFKNIITPNVLKDIDNSPSPAPCDVDIKYFSNAVLAAVYSSFILKIANRLSLVK
jgi:hypothetical protein